MDLKVKTDIESNVFSVNITVDAFGSEQLSEDEEKELLKNFPSKVAYRNLKFSKNIKINGSVPEITTDEANSKTVVSVTLPALSNKEIQLDENFNAYYKVDYTKIPPSAVDSDVLTSRELVAHAYCIIFTQVVCDAVETIMNTLRSKSPSFEGETIISV